MLLLLLLTVHVQAQAAAHPFYLQSLPAPPSHSPYVAAFEAERTRALQVALSLLKGLRVSLLPGARRPRRCSCSCKRASSRWRASSQLRLASRLRPCNSSSQRFQPRLVMRCVAAVERLSPGPCGKSRSLWLHRSSRQRTLLGTCIERARGHSVLTLRTDPGLKCEALIAPFAAADGVAQQDPDLAAAAVLLEAKMQQLQEEAVRTQQRIHELQKEGDEGPAKDASTPAAKTSIMVRAC